tara:strand:+ start:5335 stop:5715 length:381 start_codon:yes stop_codon:yes gene_type:complete
MSNIDTHLSSKDIVNMQQSATMLYDSLRYKNTIIREHYEKNKFKNGLLNSVLVAQRINTPRSILKIYTFCILNPYRSCLLFRGLPQFFEKMMSDLQRLKKNKKYNKNAVKYYIKVLPLIYANIPLV